MPVSEADLFLCSVAQSVEERDPDLGDHCRRLASLATALGKALGLSEREQLALRLAGYLHDIGKIGIPDRILFKRGPLTSDEWEVMKTHPARGERICSRTRSLGDVLPIVRHHHEKWDGTGYPDGLKEEQIPLLARIVQVVDIYDALTTTRPYKSASSREEAIAIMRQEARRGWRDRALVELFIELISGSPNGSELDETSNSLRSLEQSIEHWDEYPKPA